MGDRHFKQGMSLSPCDHDDDDDYFNDDETCNQVLNTQGNKYSWYCVFDFLHPAPRKDSSLESICPSPQQLWKGKTLKKMFNQMKLRFQLHPPLPHTHTNTHTQTHTQWAKSITTVNVELIRQPKSPNWPTVTPPSPFPHLLLMSLASIFDIWGWLVLESHYGIQGGTVANPTVVALYIENPYPCFNHRRMIMSLIEDCPGRDSARVLNARSQKLNYDP